MLVFGSFTEEETQSWVGKGLTANGTNSKEKKMLQRRSKKGLNEITFGDFCGDPGKHLDSTTKKMNYKPTLVQKEESAKFVKAEGSSHGGELGAPNGNMKLVSELADSPHKENCLHLVDEEDNNGRTYEREKENGTIGNLSSASSSNGIETEKMRMAHLCLSPDKLSEKNDHGGTNDGSMKSLQNGFMLDKASLSLAKFGDLQPHGLVNSGNLCFLNSTLQALLCCSPFVQLLQELRTRYISKASSPTITAFLELILEFNFPCASKMQKDMTLSVGKPLLPTMFENVLKDFSPDLRCTISCWSREEDAQEFLSFLMDRMHDELLKLKGKCSSLNGGKSSIAACSAPDEEEEDDDEWVTVGPKNKSSVTRTQSFTRSELSDIFGGQLRSVVKASGNKASATIQPFLLLNLDIHPDSVRTIENALHLFAAAENLEGYKTSTSGKASVVSAKKYVKIEALPRVLILHLMRFSYGGHGSTKLHKPVQFPYELVLSKDLFSSQSYEGRRYELTATISHHGKNPSKGHYTADGRQPNGQWLRFNDSYVSAIAAHHVFHDQAYVLFYQQM